MSDHRLSSSSQSGADSTGEEEFDVEEIRQWRFNRRTKNREFLIKWRGYPEEDNSWEPEENLNCQAAIGAFRKKLSKRERVYFGAKNPDHLTGLQRNAKMKSIACDASSISLKGSTSSSRTEIGSDGCKFVLMIVFDDDDKSAEEVTITDLFRHRPEEAFEWIEGRLINESALQNRRDVLL